MSIKPLSQAYLQRFGGIARLYGQEALNRFSSAHVCVIGIGGVGSWAAESLIRSGIGHLTLIDFDEICITNTNRQIHALQNTIGLTKADVMKARLFAINPESHINVIEDFINNDTLNGYLTDEKGARFDFIIDAIDSVKDKSALINFCKRNKLKLITIGGAGGQKDPTQIKISDLAKTVQDPLLAKVRAQLKSTYHLHKDSKGKYAIPAVYSTEQLIYPAENGLVCYSKNDALDIKRMDCASGFGAITTVTATFGFVAVSYVLNKLSK